MALSLVIKRPERVSGQIAEPMGLIAVETVSVPVDKNRLQKTGYQSPPKSDSRQTKLNP